MHIPFPRGRKGGIVRKCWIKASLKPHKANSKLCTSMYYDIKHLRCLCFSSFTDSNTFFSGSVLSAAHFGRHPIALVPPTSWGLQHNQNLLSQLHKMDSQRLPSHLPGLSGSPQLQRKIPQCLTCIPCITLKPELFGQCYQLGWNLAPSLNYIFINFNPLLLTDTFLRPFTFIHCRDSWVGLA